MNVRKPEGGWKHIVFDMDDTLASFVGPALELASKMFGRQFPLPPHGQYASWFNTVIREEERAEFFSRVNTPEFYLGLPSVFPIGHRHGLNELSQFCWESFREIRVVTARAIPLGEHAEAVTRMWLAQNGWCDAHLVDVRITAAGKPKLPQIPSEPAIVVEDSPAVAQEILDRTDDHAVLLVKAPWNIGLAPQKNLHVTSSQDLLQNLKMMLEYTPHRPKMSTRTWV
jgi:5' nucleotidase, deoxy (Pyrimidine), cytosolic type C protein (NT5C)